jgi:hypothetical protein
MSSFDTLATVWPMYKPPIDEYRVFGGMGFGKGNSSTRRKPAPVSSYPLQIRYDLTWGRNLITAVGSRRITARGCFLGLVKALPVTA